MVVTQDGDVSGKTFPFCDTLTDRHQYEVIAVFKTVVYTDSSDSFKAIPHNSKCRYGERGAAAAKPKAQIILCVLSSILATQMPCRSRRSGA